jgi:hypothetical protein
MGVVLRLPALLIGCLRRLLRLWIERCQRFAVEIGAL